MSPSDADYVAQLLARRLGLPVNAVLTAEDRLVITPDEVHQNDGFGIEVRTTWRTADVRFVPGKFARPLIERMGCADAEARMAFSALATAAGRQAKLTFRVNGVDVDPEKDASWPTQW